MHENFLKFKRRIWKEILIKSISVGLSAGFLAVGVILLACKLADVSLLYSAIGAVAAFIGFGVTFLLLKTDDKKIAKRLDNVFSLNEKVQTMVEFRDSDGAMVEIQREDALATLGKHRAKELKFNRLWIFLVVLCVTLALFITALALPQKQAADDTVQEDPPREITDWEWKKLDELIEYVENSEADSEIMKPKTLSALNVLRRLLKNGVSFSSLESFVSVTVTDVNNACEEANAEDISDAQKKSNRDVRNRVVDELYDMFDLSEPTTDKPEGGTPDVKPDTPDEEEEDEESDTEDSSISFASRDKIFDPEKGFVEYGDVIDQYYGEISKIFADGVISEDEWYEFMYAYFRYLRGLEQ